MAEFKLERFKYNWRGEWTTGTAYKRDDIVRVNGKSYVCILTHVASATFRADLDAILPGSVPPQPQPKWTVMTNGFSFIGDWTGGSNYNLGDIVKYDGSLWICTINHASTSFASDINNWIVFSQVTSFQGEWGSNTSYASGSVVKYGGNLYKCLVTHTSTSALNNDIDNWEVYLEGIEWRGDYASGTLYRINDFVKYGGTIFRCIETHTSAGNSIDDTRFEVEVFGTQTEGVWNSTANYNIGDIVRHEGFMYYAINNNIDSKPFVDSITGSLDWILLARNINFTGDWSVTGIYKTGDVVLRGGNLYQALRDIGGVIEVAEDIEGAIPTLISGELLDGSTLDYLDPGTWELMIPGKSWKGPWETGTVYSVGDIIIWKGSTYTCNIEHAADFTNYPGDNGSGYNYWDILVEAGQPAALYAKGDLLTYGLNREIDNDGSTVFDDSSVGDTRLPIGNSEQLLSVSGDLEVFWRDIVEDADTIYVSTNGIDDDGRGTFQKPFRTIRYAAEHVIDTYPAGSPVIIRVGTGKFEEIAPIVVPAGCAVNGDELRSTTVVANKPIPAYQNDYPYALNYLNHFVAIILDIITGNEIVPQPGNDVSQIFEILEPVINPFTGLPEVDQDNNPIVSNSFPASDINGANAIVALLDDWKEYVEFNTLDGETNPTVTGSNVENTDLVVKNAAAALRLNKQFLKKEIYAYLTNQFPDVTFDEIRIRSDVSSIITGLIRDIEYSGNYATLLSAQRYANAIKGSQTEDLFYLRDTTGLRDMTTGGLEGVLNPPGVFELYQKPTGGALVSLDPGWGPDDERTWITNRSPYIQGVTNTGFGCVGMKVDGALHNGGNKSMTANDFTQVLSDGIGAWITNNARAELVSVFTYYCQIGYFAEDGGIIRAANGNNSYGRYGSIADGRDETEVPQEVAAFNRNNQALVSEAFAGGVDDSLYIFEYANAGEEYTTADATIVGAGANADVEYTDFRDGGIFEERLISADGSSKAGGAGYLRRQGVAQETPDASTVIKLSATDVTQFLSEIEGMRIFITDGTGVGQYGYIDDFVFATKEVTVRRDSDDELGWDHLIPGTPLVSAFDLTTRYRIEPRLTLPAPPFSTASGNLFTNRTYVDMEFGNITETYTNITAGGNIIWRDDIDTRITVSEVISDTAIQFTANLASEPLVPFTIRGRETGIEAEVINISANTGEVIEVDVESGALGFAEGEEIDLLLESGSGNTFDGSPIPSRFTVVRAGTEYNVTLTNPGAGYTVGDKITISGAALGGETPANDLTITVTEVSDDSTSSILNFTSEGTGRGGRFVSLTSAENARFSDDGLDWTEVTLPLSDYKKLVHGNNRFLALSHNTNALAYSLNGISWDLTVLPSVANWNDGVYGDGKFVLVNGTDIVASSTNGTTWTTSSIPDDTDGAPDSTESVWNGITYGKGKYVAISSSDGATATSADGVTWTRHDSALSFNPDYIAYGNNRFVAVAGSDGETAYSFDGITWYSSSTLTTLARDVFIIGETDNYQVSQIKYKNGIFFVIGTNGGTALSTAYTSEDGVRWVQRSMPSSQIWSAITYGNSQWVVKASAASTNAIAIVNVGAQAKVRAEIGVGIIDEIRILDPGSGYSLLSPPQLTITDPNVIVSAATESRVGNRVLSQPEFINRGAGYRSSTSTITISGDGYADVIPVGNTLTVSGVITIPGPGVQIQIEGIEDPTALVPGTLYIFSGVTVEDLGDDGTGNETRLVRFQISPRLDVEYVVNHGTNITLREKFSQCRLSGHDFLDIGTGNFEQTNYPTIYAGGAFFTAAPENEVYESNNGRVYYVSTDQDGNFRTGELFSVQQATGIVTISAEFFDLDGLSELSLGGVRLGGSGTIVSEFSTDPTFAADSNNVIPTQRAIVTFLADRLSVGGESLEVNRLQAGRVILGGTANEINTNTGQYVVIPSNVNFDGTYESNDGAGNITTNQTAVSGTIISQMLYFKVFDESMQ
jgi:hypothetical protein